MSLVLENLCCVGFLGELNVGAGFSWAHGCQYKAFIGLQLL